MTSNLNSTKAYLIIDIHLPFQVDINNKNIFYSQLNNNFIFYSK